MTIPANSMQRAVDFITNAGHVLLKADGSTPATLNPPTSGWTNDYLVSYLLQEARIGNFRDVMRSKGYGSIYLIAQGAASVLHIRVMEHRAGIFHYVD